MSPMLYQAIEKAGLGEIRVANEGEGAIWGGTSYVNGRVQRSLVHWGESYKLNCPFCNDLRFRLYVPHLYGQPDRENGNRPMTCCVKCFNEDCLANSEVRRRFADMVLGFRNRNQRGGWPVKPATRESACSEEPVPPGMSLRLTDLPLTHPAVRYLTVDRRIPYQVLVDYDLGVCLEPNRQLTVACWLYNRIIIPIRFHGELVGWQARYVGEPANKDVPKYVTMPGMKKSQLLYNFDRAVTQPYVVVVEGVTDVWAVGDCAVAAFGKTLSARQHALLGEHWRGKPVVLLLDADADESREKQSSILRRSGNHPAVVVVELPDGSDPGTYDTATITNMIRARAAEAGVSIPATLEAHTDERAGEAAVFHVQAATARFR
jgi:hypothetical protein